MSQTELTFEDRQRLAKQTEAVWSVMQDHVWRTFGEIQNLIVLRLRVHASEASISARLRELRGKGHQVDRRHREGSPRGVFEYRVWPQ